MQRVWGGFCVEGFDGIGIPAPVSKIPAQLQREAWAQIDRKRGARAQAQRDMNAAVIGRIRREYEAGCGRVAAMAPALLEEARARFLTDEVSIEDFEWQVLKILSEVDDWECRLDR